jgi:hypothetical protein
MISHINIYIHIYPLSGPLDIPALQGGDYLQMLNFFPLDGMELTLKQFRIIGINGFQELSVKALENWVKDVYANQMHRVSFMRMSMSMSMFMYTFSIFLLVYTLNTIFFYYFFFYHITYFFYHFY